MSFARYEKMFGNGAEEPDHGIAQSAASASNSKTVIRLFAGDFLRDRRGIAGQQQRFEPTSVICVWLRSAGMVTALDPATSSCWAF